MKRLLSIFIMVCATIVASAETYNVRVAGIEVTDENKDNITGPGITGKVSYLPKLKKLVLENATIVGQDSYGGIYFGDMDWETNYTIGLLGVNTVEAVARPAIACRATLVFVSQGLNSELNATTQRDKAAIYTEGGLKFDCSTSTINATSGYKYAIQGYYSQNDLVINKGVKSIRATGDVSGIHGYGKMELVDTYISEPFGSTYDSNRFDVVDKEGNVAREVEIRSGEGYPILVKGIRVDSQNASDVLGDGTVSYSPLARTLTLNNANISGEQGIYLDIEHTMSIKCKGENKIHATDGHAIYVAYNGTNTNDRNVNFVGESGSTLEAVSESAAAIKFYRSTHLFYKCNITAVGADYGICGDKAYTLIAQEATLHAKGAVGAFCFDSEHLVDCHVTSPVGAVLDKNKAGYVLGDEICTDVTIEPYELYPLTVKGIKVNSNNCADILGDGTVSYDPENRELTLNNANISGGQGIYLDMESSTQITLKGENKIHATNGNAIYVTWHGTDTNDRTVHFVGESGSTLEAVSESAAAIQFLYAGHYFFRCNITAVGADYGIYGGQTYSLRVDSSTLHAKGSVGAFCFEREYLFDCRVTSPVGAVLDKNKVGYVLGDEICTDVTITAIEQYPLYVMGVKVNSDNCTDILGDGQVSYDPETSTLTLADGTKLINTDKALNIIEAECDLTIQCLGDVALTAIRNWAPMAFVGKYNVTLTGGKMTVESPQQPCIYYYCNGDCTLTIKDMEFVGSTQMANIYSWYGANLVIDNAKCSFTMYESPIYGFDTVTLKGGCEVTNPKGAVYDSTSREYDVEPHGELYTFQIAIPDYGITIGDVHVTGANRDDVLGDGTISYDPEELTLTLNNADISGEKGIYLDIAHSTTILLKGDNKVHATNGNAIYVEWNGENTSDRTITLRSEDGGTLEAVSESAAAIKFFRSVNYFDHCNITAVGADYGIFGGLSYTLRANSSTLQARGDVNALCFERESLVDCHVISPEGAVLDEKKVGYVLGDELCTDVTILPDAVSIESVSDSSNAPRYNLQGIRVDNNYRGIIIQNGKRLLVR